MYLEKSRIVGCLCFVNRTLHFHYSTFPSTDEWHVYQTFYKHFINGLRFTAQAQTCLYY